MDNKTTELAEIRSLDGLDGRAGRADDVKEREWWEVVSLGRRYTTRFRDEAVDLCDLAASKGMPFRLWRVVAVERTRYVEEPEISSPIVRMSDCERGASK